MTTWEQAYRSAGVLATQLHGDLDIDLERPVDVFAAIERLGIVLAFGQLERVSGVYVPSQSPNTPPGILIHEGHPPARQRFTAAHELGHHMFNHGLEVDGDIDMLLRQNLGLMPDVEKEAEAFAAWFLMPRRLLRAGIRELSLLLRSPADAYELSLWLGTSYVATVRQLATMRLLSSSVSEAWVTVPPKSIKVGLTGGHHIDDLRNDVWRLDAASNQHPLTVRPGDRLLLQLDENISTGYTWTPTEVPDGVEIVADSFEEQWEPDEGWTPSGDDQPPGRGRRRSFLISISHHLPDSILRLALELIRPWQPARKLSEYELLIGISQRRYGVQEPEDRLRLPA